MAQQPKDIVVASLSEEINNIPAFAQRSILTGREFAYAYHPAYYSQIQQRTIDLIYAQYGDNIVILQSFIKQHNIDYIMIEKTAFTPEYLLEKDWLINSSWKAETQNAITKLTTNYSPAIINFIEPCSVVTTENFNLISTDCILKNSLND